LKTLCTEEIPFHQTCTLPWQPWPSCILHDTNLQEEVAVAAVVVVVVAVVVILTQINQ
jgi:hypothetical protein